MKKVKRILLVSLAFMLAVMIMPQFVLASLMKGDGNGDGVINTADVFLVSKYVNGKTTLTPEQLFALDVNNDGQVTAEDGDLIKQFYLGKISSFPGASSSAPALMADSTANYVGNPIEITFTDDTAWRSAITDVLIDGVQASGKYAVHNGLIMLDTSLFPVAKDYTVTVKASGYTDATVIQTVSAPINTNHNPTIDTLPAQTLQVGSSAQQLDLAAYLHDVDNDALTVTADTNDHSIATVTVSGDTLTLMPVGAGQTQATVTVSDGRGGTATASIPVEVKAAPAGQNQAPEVISSIYEQVLTAGVTNARTYDLTQLFEDPDGDELTFTAVSQTSGIVAASVSGNLLTLTPDSTAGSTKVRITADDGKGGTATHDFTVRNAPLAPNGQVEIRTKQGVNDSITYDLSSIFPNQTTFQMYGGTPDSTIIGPEMLSGNIWTWKEGAWPMVWVIGANGTAVVLHVTVNPQGPEDLYFSQYMDMGNGRTAIQLFYNPVGDTLEKISGYELEVHQYKLKTGQETSYTRVLFPIQKGIPYLFIDRVFYDLFDITNVQYYNDELVMYDPGNTVTTGFVLKKNGVVIDVLGDPTSHSQFIPKGGTIIRKSGIHGGSSSFNLYGEWNSFPAGTVQYLGGHTP